MKAEEALKLIDNELIFWSRLGFGTDPPVLDENDEIILHESIEQNMKYCSQAFGTGIKILSSNLHSGWVGIDKYNYKTTDKVLDALFSKHPDVYYIPRIKLNAPFEWQEAHPDDLYIYENADFKNSDEIKACIGTDMQDGPGSIDRNRKMGYQSFASEKWAMDAKEALRRAIGHIEEKYGDRILGYQVGYGKCGESHFWGDSADYSVANKKTFYEFGVKKYKSAKALSDAWRIENITPENIVIPKNAERYKQGAELDEFFNMGDGHVIYRDYNEYRRELSLSLVNSFCKVAKEKSGGKLVGIFHGYIMHSGADYHGHTDLEEILKCEYIDYIAAPKSYYRNAYGEPCGSYCVPMSVNRKKLWLDEIDVRTYKSIQAEYSGGEVNGTAGSIEETKWVLWRELARNEMTGSAYWYMDLGGGWYDDDEILKELGKLYEMRKTLSEKKHESISEILLVVDEENMMMTTPSYKFHLRALQDTACEAAMTGAPYDMYRQKDLPEIDLSKYKLVIFLNAFSMDYKEFSDLKFADNTHFIWSYAPGYINGDTKKLTGMDIKETGQFEEFPYLEIEAGDGVEVIEAYDEIPMEYENIPKLENLPKCGIKTAMKGNHILAVLPSVKRNIIRSFAEKAGCRMYAPLNSIVYADNRFTAIFDEAGYTFKLNE